MNPRSPWYTLGMWYGAVRWSARHGVSPLKVLQIALAARIVAEVTENIEEATERVTKRLGRTRPGPPPLPPSKAAELSMPTEYPERREFRPAPWPPFTGVRVELGGDSA